MRYMHDIRSRLLYLQHANDFALFVYDRTKLIAHFQRRAQRACRRRRWTWDHLPSWQQPWRMRRTAAVEERRGHLWRCGTSSTASLFAVSNVNRGVSTGRGVSPCHRVPGTASSTSRTPSGASSWRLPRRCRKGSREPDGESQMLHFDSN